MISKIIGLCKTLPFIFIFMSRCPYLLLSFVKLFSFSPLFFFHRKSKIVRDYLTTLLILFCNFQYKSIIFIFIFHLVIVHSHRVQGNTRHTECEQKNWIQNEVSIMISQIFLWDLTLPATHLITRINSTCTNFLFPFCVPSFTFKVYLC